MKRTISLQVNEEIKADHPQDDAYLNESILIKDFCRGSGISVNVDNLQITYYACHYKDPRQVQPAGFLSLYNPVGYCIHKIRNNHHGR